MLLLMLIAIPFIFGLLCWQFEYFGIWMPRWIALLGMSIFLCIILLLWIRLKIGCCFLSVLEMFLVIPDESSRWYLEYIFTWISRFGINFHFALDGLSLLMLVLSGILGVIAVLSSWYEIRHYQGLFYLNLLWTIGGVIGVFLSLDMFLFFFFWEMILIPIYFLISLWGCVDPNREACISAATKFFIYTQCSGLFMLISIIIHVSINYHMNGV